MKDALQELREAVAVLLDQVDYTSGACSPGEPIGGVLGMDVLARVKEALAASGVKP